MQYATRLPSYLLLIIIAILTALGIGLAYRTISVRAPLAPEMPIELPPRIARPRTRSLRGLETEIKRIRKQLAEKPVVKKKPKIKRQVRKTAPKPKPKKRFKKLKPKDLRKLETKLKNIQQGISEEISRKHTPHAKKTATRIVKAKKRRIRKTKLFKELSKLEKEVSGIEKSVKKEIKKE